MSEYILPLVLAVLLHAALAVTLMRGWQAGADSMPTVVTPKIIEAKILVMERPKARAPLPSALPDPAPLPLPKPAEPPPKPKPVPIEQPREQAEPLPEPDPEVERIAREDAARRERLRELAEQSTALAFEDEQASLQDAMANEQTATYASAIQRAVMAQWSRPPSARLGMRARFSVVLVPSGDILSVLLLESSGDAPFDRSAEQAIKKVRRFTVPPELDLFEKHFRTFTLLFDPQDLLQ